MSDPLQYLGHNNDNTETVKLSCTYDSMRGVPQLLGVEVGLVHCSQDVEGISSRVT